MAHVQKRGKKYVARYVGPDRVERSKSFTRKIDAEAFLTTMEDAKLRRAWIDPALGLVELSDYARGWLIAITPTLKPKTTAAYESLLRSRILPSLGKVRLADLKPSDCQAWINGMTDLSPSRVRQAHVVLAQVLDAAVRDDRIVRNPARGSRLPRLERREAPFLEPRTVQCIAEELPVPYDLLVRVLGTLGLRFGEAAALRRRSVDLLGRRLLVTESLAEISGRHVFGRTKTHADRRVPLTRSLRERFETHFKNRVPQDTEALIFTSPEGAALRHSTFRSRYWLPALERAGVPRVGVHVLRHSAAAAMIQSGASPKAVQTVLGHASAAFTLTVYGHIFEADLDAVAEGLERTALASTTGHRRDEREMPRRTVRPI
jgi:integrase